MSEKRQGSALTFIFITMLIDVIGLGIIIPVMPKLIMELSGEGLSSAARYGGWMVFAYAAMQFFFSPILGGLSDQYGRRPILLFSLFGFGIDYIILGFAPTIGWLFFGRVVAGITGASFTAAGAYIADVSPPEKRAQNFGLIGAAFGLGFILGPVLGGFLGTYGARVPFFVSAGLALLNWLYGYFILPESLKVENRRKFEWSRSNPINSLLNLRRYPIVLGLVFPNVLIMIAGFATQTTWTYYCMDKFSWTEKMVGLSLGFVGVMAALVQGGLTRALIPRLGNYRSISFGLLLYSIGFVLYALADQGWMMFAITVIASLGGIAMPALQGVMSNQVPMNEQGELRGALTSVMSLTSVVGPLIMTNLFAYFTSSAAPIQLPGAPFWMGALLIFLSWLWIIQSLKGLKI
ncbi:TCR/Tet family MFS transporter [Haliscomenobacter hydrossis]|uniref:Major facilitator superfamily MFS_1 n=1 Tax=Haliscomenobacter hydrossis (strain ATCC 27775 / DSM 1100 / LMG 10767 / O) TaxID=760192 RepID=F4KXV5_HALH1|nr:tetracycline resistance MFS efflux pump [Haliscomenobacter hydrossis]AEE52614.1 major facilitator superfamily MFS_1 [Haliscomenobacter hydrossis DSM 1100]